jgi:glutaredoxin
MRLILYSKPGCHLCEGLQEKLEQITSIEIQLEVRDITTREDWFQAYQYEIPVLYIDHSANGQGRQPAPDAQRLTSDQNQFPALQPLPRLSPRATVKQVEQMLQKYLGQNKAE